ncbi:hypothetical protein DPMN_191178 [Dreissena polymorpha]|uniref:Uncharacterized protein n=1 Tax=Dreissena polymorpha TaxID=45954 RepID=A0A9D4BC96_DREPO|nr:hypothetical protein DPMN_191178 [Dreissena polymorpha]
MEITTKIRNTKSLIKTNTRETQIRVPKTTRRASLDSLSISNLHIGIGYRSRLLFKARFSVGPLPWVALPSPASRNVGYEAHAPYPRRCLTGWVDENVSEHGLKQANTRVTYSVFKAPKACVDLLRYVSLRQWSGREGWEANEGGSERASERASGRTGRQVMSE